MYINKHTHIYRGNYVNLIFGAKCVLNKLVCFQIFSLTFQFFPSGQRYLHANSCPTQRLLKMLLKLFWRQLVLFLLFLFFCSPFYYYAFVCLHFWLLFFKIWSSCVLTPLKQHSIHTYIVAQWFEVMAFSSDG